MHLQVIDIPGIIHEAINFYTLEELITLVESGNLDPLHIEEAQGFCELPPQ